MHIPVLLKEVIEALKPQAGKTYIDCTFGKGGYTKELLKHNGVKVIALDRDPTVMPTAERISELYGDRFHFINSDFGSLEARIAELKVSDIAGIVFDIGVSSMQIDEAERGFSFYKNGPLDMRMDPDIQFSAADIVNTYGEKEIADILYKYGDERFSRAIAKKIVERRQTKEFRETVDLAELIRSAYSVRLRDTHPATKSFQALRIFVNDELNQLQKGLKSAKNIVERGGRLVVVTFHSGEDRIVKHYFNELCGKKMQGYSPFGYTQDVANFKLVNKNSIAPSDGEVNINPRARSAKLRAIERIA